MDDKPVKELTSSMMEIVGQKDGWFDEAQTTGQQNLLWQDNVNSMLQQLCLDQKESQQANQRRYDEVMGNVQALAALVEGRSVQ